MSFTDAPANVLHEVDEDSVFLRYDPDQADNLDIPRHLAARAERGSYYLIIDLSKAPRLTTQANEEGPASVKAGWFLGVVFLNASALMRMGLKVFHLGMFLTGQEDFPSTHVKSMDEARKAVDDMRARRTARS